MAIRPNGWKPTPVLTVDRLTALVAEDEAERAERAEQREARRQERRAIRERAKWERWRAEAQQIAALRAQGLTWQQVAGRMGMSLGAAYSRGALSLPENDER